VSGAATAPRRLNLGCGRDIRPGWVNLDRAALPGVDVVHDLERLPLPFADASFDEILAKDVLEHVDYIPLLREICRLLRAGGRLDVQVPHFTSVDNYVDPTHRNRFSVRTFEYFVADSTHARDYYFDFQFSRIVDRRLTFPGWPLVYNSLVAPLVNAGDLSRKYYELTFLSRLFPASNLVVTLIR
jgi:SAM-dependent methyltransferase